MILLLTKSVRITVPAANTTHQHPVFLKLMVTSKTKNKYNGIHMFELRNQGNIQSKKALLHWLLITLKRCLSYESSCSIKCKMYVKQALTKNN